MANSNNFQLLLQIKIPKYRDGQEKKIKHKQDVK